MPHVTPETRSASIRPPRGACWEIDATRDNCPLGPGAFAQGEGSTTREVDLFPNPEVEESQTRFPTPPLAGALCMPGLVVCFPICRAGLQLPAGAGCELTAEIAGSRRPEVARSRLATWLRGEAPLRTVRARRAGAEGKDRFCRVLGKRHGTACGDEVQVSSGGGRHHGSLFLRRGGVWRESSLHCHKRHGMFLHFHRRSFG